jgi:hypothetical protein
MDYNRPLDKATANPIVDLALILVSIVPLPIIITSPENSSLPSFLGGDLGKTVH